MIDGFTRTAAAHDLDQDGRQALRDRLSNSDVHGQVTDASAGTERYRRSESSQPRRAVHASGAQLKKLNEGQPPKAADR